MRPVPLAWVLERGSVRAWARAWESVSSGWRPLQPWKGLSGCESLHRHRFLGCRRQKRPAGKRAPQLREGAQTLTVGDNLVVSYILLGCSVGRLAQDDLAGATGMPSRSFEAKRGFSRGVQAKRPRTRGSLAASCSRMRSAHDRINGHHIDSQDVRQTRRRNGASPGFGQEARHDKTERKKGGPAAVPEAAGLGLTGRRPAVGRLGQRLGLRGFARSHEPGVERPRRCGLVRRRKS